MPRWDAAVDEADGSGTALIATDGSRPGAVIWELAADLASAESGLGFVYAALDKLVERWELRDAVIVVDHPLVGRQAFRAGRRPLLGGWAERVALSGEAGLHTDPPMPSETDHLAAAGDLAAVALRLDSLRYDSLHDPLTGLYNRRSFDDHLTQAVGRSRRYAWPFSLVLVDLDNFKTVNDQLGHAVGDAVLRAIGVEMRRVLRRGDVAARIGGDEFALILPGAEATLVPRLIERLRAGVGRVGAKVAVGFSTGSASCPQEGDDIDALTRLADARLYEAKGRS